MQNRPCLSAWKRCHALSRIGVLDSSPVAGTIFDFPALSSGARLLTRKEAVPALQALGFRKAAASNALAPGGKFGTLIEFYPDGLIEWLG